MRPPLELWGGLECTVNRVGDRTFDQLERSGHPARADDLERIAGLGVRTLRYPLLWERHQPERDEPIRWDWADRQLARTRSLGLRVIAGLVHHGSGPRHTGLVEPSFAPGLAAYARAVAERYPWLDRYTPVNEPLTTARFSGLYGHWYPHGRDDRTFCRALLNQCRATVLAMRAIREVNPAAQLVQTDDLGHTTSTPALRSQADFDNARRWLTWDLLAGRVDRRHPLWAYLFQSGAGEAELGAFADDPCPPDVVGVNYYVTSERFLDERTDRYPGGTRGGNGRQAYADVETVRADPPGFTGVGPLLEAAWERYRLPLAVTEAHLGCTREEQLRWLRDIWQAADAARARGADVRAVTAWALFGSFDWDSLVTRDDGHYEPGAFDLRSLPPRPTALARLIGELSTGRAPNHPVLATPGWWDHSHGVPDGRESLPRPLLIVAGSGALGPAFAHACRERGLAHVLQDDRTAFDEALRACRPWAVVNATVEAEPPCGRCGRIASPLTLTRACAAVGARLMTFAAGRAVEADRSPATGHASRRSPPSLIVRTGDLFGSRDDHGFPAADDAVSTSQVAAFVHACLDLLIDGEGGEWQPTTSGTSPALLSLRPVADRRQHSLPTLPAACDRPVRDRDAGSFVIAKETVPGTSRKRGTVVVRCGLIREDEFSPCQEQEP